MPVEGEYEPSAQAWVRDQVELYEGSGGTQGTTLRDTGLPVVIVTNLGVKSGKVRKTPVMRVECVGVQPVYDIQTESGEYLAGHVRVHNCFILAVDDTMDSILTLARTEGMLFKFGSGAGSNLSTIRSSKEKMTGGGTVTTAGGVKYGSAEKPIGYGG